MNHFNDFVAWLKDHAAAIFGSVLAFQNAGIIGQHTADVLNLVRGVFAALAQ
jgi:hypothetical protein